MFSYTSITTSSLISSIWMHYSSDLSLEPRMHWLICSGGGPRTTTASSYRSFGWPTLMMIGAHSCWQWRASCCGRKLQWRLRLQAPVCMYYVLLSWSCMCLYWGLCIASCCAFCRQFVYLIRCISEYIYISFNHLFYEQEKCHGSRLW